MLIALGGVADIAKRKHGGTSEVAVFEQQSASARVANVEHEVDRNIALGRTAVERYLGGSAYKSDKIDRGRCKNRYSDSHRLSGRGRAAGLYSG